MSPHTRAKQLHITGKSTTLGDGAACGWSLAQCRRLPGIDMSIENGRRRHCVLLPNVMRHAQHRLQVP